MIVHLELAAEEPPVESLAQPLELRPVFIGIELRQAVAVDEDRVGDAEVAQVAGQDLVEAVGAPTSEASSSPSRMTCSMTVAWLPRETAGLTLTRALPL